MTTLVFIGNDWMKVDLNCVYILDLDNTIADAESEFQRCRELCLSCSCGYMRENLENPNYWCDRPRSLCPSWQKAGFFNSQVVIQFPVYPGARMFLKKLQRGYIVSGRSESQRGMTCDWFEKHDLPIFPLYLHGPGDPLDIPTFKAATVGRLKSLFGKKDERWVWVEDDERIRSIAERMGIEFIRAPMCWESMERGG